MTSIGSDRFVEGLEMAAFSMHKALRGVPIAVKARHGAGVLIEEGEFRAAGLEISILDRVFSGDSVQQAYIGEGRHAGSVMFASAIADDRGRRVAAIGVIDKYGILPLKEFLASADCIERQLYGRKPRR